MGSKEFVFSFDEKLVGRLEERAKSQRMSLNAYIENLLIKELGHIPNDKTAKAFEELSSGKGEKINYLEEWLENI